MSCQRGSFERSVSKNQIIPFLTIVKTYSYESVLVLVREEKVTKFDGFQRNIISKSANT